MGRKKDRSNERKERCIPDLATGDGCGCGYGGHSEPGSMHGKLSDIRIGPGCLSGSGFYGGTGWGHGSGGSYGFAGSDGNGMPRQQIK